MRILAAERGTSVSAIVTEYLRTLSLQGGPREFDRLESQQRRIQREIKRFRAEDRLGRDEIHVTPVASAESLSSAKRDLMAAAAGRSGRSDVSERIEEILRNELG